jgi:hypothetical protein
VVSIALAFLQLWRQKQSKVAVSGLSVVVLWISSFVVFGMILFSQAIANALANAVGD